jgi:hypothetical protein
VGRPERKSAPRISRTQKQSDTREERVFPRDGLPVELQRKLGFTSDTPGVDNVPEVLIQEIRI